MSSRSSRSTLDCDGQSRLPVSDTTAVAGTDWTPRRRVREATSHGTSPFLGNPSSIPASQSRAFPVSPRRNPHVDSRDHYDGASRPLTRFNRDISSLDHAASKRAILEDRFEKMLALLDMDNSESGSDSVDRRKEVNMVVDGATASVGAGRSRVCRSRLLTTSLAADKIADQA
jgi:hypothetical protein